MAENGLVLESGKREDIKSEMSDLDKARMNYENDYNLDDFIEEPVTFTGAKLSKIIEPKDKNKTPFAILELYDDEEEQVTKIFANFKFPSKTPRIYSGSKIYPLLQAITGDTDSEYMKVDYGLLQSIISDIKSITIEGVEIEDGDYEYTGFKVLNLVK